MRCFRGHWVVGQWCQIEAFSSATTPWCWARKDGSAKFLPLRHSTSKSVMFASSRIALDPFRPPTPRHHSRPRLARGLPPTLRGQPSPRRPHPPIRTHRMPPARRLPRLRGPRPLVACCRSSRRSLAAPPPCTKPSAPSTTAPKPPTATPPSKSSAKPSPWRASLSPSPQTGTSSSSKPRLPPRRMLLATPVLHRLYREEVVPGGDAPRDGYSHVVLVMGATIRRCEAMHPAVSHGVTFLFGAAVLATGHRYVGLQEEMADPTHSSNMCERSASAP